MSKEQENVTTDIQTKYEVVSPKQLRQTFKTISQLPLFNQPYIVYRSDNTIAIDGELFMSMVDRTSDQAPKENPDQDIIDKIAQEGSIFVQGQFCSDSEGNIYESTVRVPVSIIRSLGPTK